MPDHAAELEPVDLSDPWVLWGLEMARLWKAAGNPPDATLLDSVARLARLREEVEARG